MAAADPEARNPFNFTPPELTIEQRDPLEEV